MVINQEFFSFFFGYVRYNVEGNLILDRAQPGCGGVASQYYRPAPVQTSAQASASNAKELQLQQLQQLQGTLSYEEYQRRYREITGQ
ncbi:hypothetical protein D3C80_2028480 [compost metagenome]